MRRSYLQYLTERQLRHVVSHDPRLRRVAVALAVADTPLACVVHGRGRLLCVALDIDLEDRRVVDDRLRARHLFGECHGSGFAATVVRQRQQRNHCVAGMERIAVRQQLFPGQTIGRAREQRVTPG